MSISSVQTSLNNPSARFDYFREGPNIDRGLCGMCTGATIATLPLSLLGAAILIETVIRIPFDLIKIYFGSNEDSAREIFERLRTSVMMLIPFVNYVYYFSTLSSSRDNVAASSDGSTQDAIKAASGILSPQFYAARPAEWALGIYDPIKLYALKEELRSGR